MEYFSYKFSIKPLPKARRVVRIVTFTILLCFVILIYGFAFGIETDIPFVARMVGSTVIALLLLYGLLYFFWLTGQFKMTDTGVLCKTVLSRQKRIGWESVRSIKRTKMLQGRSEHLDVLVFNLNACGKDLSEKTDFEQPAEFFFRKQKHFFVIMYSEERERFLSEHGFQIEIINEKIQ